jgi:hypothetical protein
MATSEKGKISIEVGRVLTAYTKMTDGGARQVFYSGTQWSGKANYAPDVRPSGIVTGKNVLSVHADNSKVTVAAFTAYSKAVLKSVSATTLTFTRSTDAGRAKVVSITMASDGSIASVHGTQGAAAAFSDTRAAAGGPPLIPVNSVELGQIRTTVSTAQPVVASEIFQVVGTHTERYDYPSWEEYNLGQGDNADTTAEKYAHIKFVSVLPAAHTGAVAKSVYIQYYTPTLAELAKTLDFKPADNSHSVSSTQYYNGTLASVASALGQSAFTALMADNITDVLLDEQDETVTVKFWPDRNKNPYLLTQGKLGVARTFPVAGQNQAVCTLSAERATVPFAS